MWYDAKEVASEPRTVPFGRTVIALHTPPVPHNPRAISVQVSSMIGVCACV